MKRLFFSLFLFTLISVSLFAQNSVAPRTRQLLNFGWKFHAGDLAGAEAKDFDDSGWRNVDLPHDFQIEQPWVAPSADERPDNTDVAANIKSRLSSRGFKEMGKGWYRLHLNLPDSLRGKRLLLDFEGIMLVGDVWLNGQRVGGTDYGYVGFDIDITNQVKWGQDNVVAVCADTREPGNSRWYTGGGLFRDVWLVATPRELYFERHPLFICTRENRLVDVSAEFTNRGRSRESQLRLTVLAPDGKAVYEGTTTKARNTQSRTMEAQWKDISIPHPQLWDTENPSLYTAVVQLMGEKGEVVDEVRERFGIRTVEFGPDFGMKLNGKKVLLKGYANHHTLGALGAAAYPQAMEKRIRLMKQFGINHIRTSHNPYSRSFIELCDQYGILVVDELYDKWTRQHTGGRVPWEYHWQYDVPEWVKRDRNSPSVVLWSLGNELQQDPNQAFNDWGVTAYKLQRTLLQRYDSTRLVTVAMHPRYRNWETDSLPCDLAMQTDIQAYNYRYMYFPGDGKRFPWMTFYQSEASVAAMGENYFAMDLNRVIGLAYWGAIDYLGESQGWPEKGWAQGVFDISLEPKPKAYYMKSFFLPDEPVVHIAVIEKKGDMMWNGVQTGNDGMTDHWNRVKGQQLQLVTYTNAEEVELLLNGKSLGIGRNASSPKMRNQIRWNNITYQPGTLEAVARTNGKVVARHRIETTGEAVRLRLTPEYTSSNTSSTRKKGSAEAGSWQADGSDLIHLRVEALDSKGRRVPGVNSLVQFQLTGDARIVGVSNGDMSSDDLHTASQVHLHNGSALVILRAGTKPSKVTLTATAEGLKPATKTQESF